MNVTETRAIHGFQANMLPTHPTDFLRPHAGVHHDCGELSQEYWSTFQIDVLLFVSENTFVILFAR